ncbi:hypothetical protein EJB05_28935 [Eragrostis curvula]|uniref:F-box domain-containing protein n=1 Tax=Eragrostis curvula TaxID=38414 RepID=A0A5J9UTK0_9POAL|nr:hypothetical protein EJB05_28935 [Eragrostis curvula]
MPHPRDNNKAPTASGRDPFGAIPDAVVHHVLGFLPARDAVLTCVLARRWRHLWRSLPRLRISNQRVWYLNRFVNRVLLLREPGVALDECEFDFCRFTQDDSGYLDLWIRQALMCRVQMLRVHLSAEERVRLADWPLVSLHLTRLELDGLLLDESFLDFSGCSVLEDLKITNCQTGTDKILSKSLKHLRITDCHLCYWLVPTHISAPSLISLQLYDYTFVTPVLESMPLLETASVKLGQNNEDYCEFYDEGGSEECSCSTCLMHYAKDERNTICVLLGGLSNVASLELIASYGMVIFKRDLRFCPTFSKLKTLSLNDWCLVADLNALLRFLQHTPVLEKLILQLCKRPKPAVEMENCNLMLQSLKLGKLKVVEVKCPSIDDRVHNILKILRLCSPCLSEVSAIAGTDFGSSNGENVQGCVTQDARSLFDGMPLPARSTASGSDRLSSLPEGVIHHVLSLLPAHDAVRTCVLARRWRHLWSSAPGIRVTGVKGWSSADKFIDFVDRLLKLRHGSAPPLEWCEFQFDPRDFNFDFYELAWKRHTRLWIGRALGCNVRMLRVSLDDMAAFRLARRPLFSQHLTRLELDCVETKNSHLDFSGCPVLVEMKMEYCFINAKEMSSASLKQLTMKECEFRQHQRTRISLPSLISLELSVYSGRAPLLGSMPSLEEAIIGLNYGCSDYCVEGGPSECEDDSCGGCQYYNDSDDDGTSCLLLNGLSEATNLQLSFHRDVFVFCRDVKRCPKFTNLKTLVLSDWCLAADLNALICFLQHSPTLEKLTLTLSGVPECSMEQEGSYNLLEPSYASNHLKLVEIKCEEVDGRVHKILKTLSAYGIPLEHINIQQTNRSSGSGCE